MLTGVAPVNPILKLRFPRLASLEAASVICNWYILAPELAGIMLIGPLFVKVTPDKALEEILAVTVIV
jgi:hypothetical protein